MDELVRKAIHQADALKKPPHSVPWKDDEPWPQPYYSWVEETGQWQPTTSRSGPQTHSTSITMVVLYSWNIDFMLPFPETRMDTALAHLQELTTHTLSDPNAAIILNLQECVPSDLVTIGQKQWIRENFYITDIDTSAWASGAYGTTTLIDHRLDISSCFRVHYSKTRMERDALFVDVAPPTISKDHGRILRFCNTHLESLALEPQLRPAQMKVIASYMHPDGVMGAVVTGDFNAIQPADLSLHSENRLKDAYLELGGLEKSDEGYTWGQQALKVLRERFGCSRMDKAYYCGGGLKLLGFERFGANVEIPEKEKDQRNQLLSLGFEKAWITDHLGIKVAFHISNDIHL
ncbi:endonuclease/exonuclease/phosphatase family protein [Talaromyces proteolyticus]|uniref:Endonuclease/exonuclease/phosphatase family protein n=1 Tax=Talaromyces proteolyticus TaxID=1131652 RepID=A0AAD4KEY3_9EURO|nr:endonuclease/exonuclease/phosphatase family protein [Talaromyces proteolyticus]KAH8690330.1 endonuclease/exonuclease/phosphatase family protein [Talaromyces proteolyticus]